jgi:hypothetical protein
MLAGFRLSPLMLLNSGMKNAPPKVLTGEGALCYYLVATKINARPSRQEGRS